MFGLVKACEYRYRNITSAQLVIYTRTHTGSDQTQASDCKERVQTRCKQKVKYFQWVELQVMK